MEKNYVSQNPLATEKISTLMLKFSIPATISFMVNALYNIVDQIFIGQGVGMLGNAATNVAFPLTTLCTSVALLIGIGSASNINLSLGAGDKKRASSIAGTSISLLTISGVLLCAFVLLFLKPLILAFGATEQVLPYALTYTQITTLGMPFVILSTGVSHIIRSDGRPLFSMICMLVGAIINTILNPIFIFGLNMGIAGAAWATVIGQVISCIITVYGLTKCKTIKLEAKHFTPKVKYSLIIVSLGAAACFNQLAMMVVQVCMNNTLTYYGNLSHYGSDIPLACVGVISKVNIILLSFVIGIAQGCQPICGFNYGAKNYKRVKESMILAIGAATIISIVFFIIFQIFPKQIVSIFGEGSDDYFEFAIKYFKIFLFFTFLNGIQPVSANFFTSIGKAKMGIILSLTRQIIFLLPLILILPLIWGIDGVMFAGPISDSVSGILAILLTYKEFKKMDKLEKL